ncbi:MAG: S8 family serine peptidase [Bacteroidetes bacterium]|nr:S8 family serine peptidase [Bacteroidota bacterium]
MDQVVVFLSATKVLLAAQNGAEIINCSWGGLGYSSINQMVCTDAFNMGSILVVAAGNNGNNTPTYPAAYNDVIAVANSTQTDAKNSNSSYGTWVDITAPGTSIFSTIPWGNYGNFSGTSMAAPLVSGLLGLIWSANLSAAKHQF